MSRLMKITTAILFLLVALLSQGGLADAEQQNNSAKDCIENPGSCNDWEPGKENSESGGKETKVGVTFWDFLRMIAATLFVAGLLYFLLRFINKKSASYKSSQLVENLGGTSLGGNRSVQIIKAGNRMLIVGVGEDIQLLKEIDDPEEFRQVIEDYNSRMDQLVQPGDVFSKLMKKWGKSEEKDPAPFSELLKSQLNDMSNGRKKLIEELQKKGPEKDE